MVMTDPVMPVTPVRAWAEYDEEATFSRLTDGDWDFVVTPKGAEGEAAAGTTESLMTAIKGRYIDAPLRSLRVLFSTGHEMRLHAYLPEQQAWEMTMGSWGFGWIKMRRTIAAGTDAEAVQRAIDAAVAWIGAQANAE